MKKKSAKIFILLLNCLFFSFSLTLKAADREDSAYNRGRAFLKNVSDSATPTGLSQKYKTIADRFLEISEQGLTLSAEEQYALGVYCYVIRSFERSPHSQAQMMLLVASLRQKNQWNKTTFVNLGRLYSRKSLQSLLFEEEVESLAEAANGRMFTPLTLLLKELLTNGLATLEDHFMTVGKEP